MRRPRTAEADVAIVATAAVIPAKEVIHEDIQLNKLPELPSAFALIWIQLPSLVRIWPFSRDALNKRMDYRQQVTKWHRCLDASDLCRIRPVGKAATASAPAPRGPPLTLGRSPRWQIGPNVAGSTGYGRLPVRAVRSLVCQGWLGQQPGPVGRPDIAGRAEGRRGLESQYRLAGVLPVAAVGPGRVRIGDAGHKALPDQGLLDLPHPAVIGGIKAAVRGGRAGNQAEVVAGRQRPGRGMAGRHGL